MKEDKMIKARQMNNALTLLAGIP